MLSTKSSQINPSFLLVFYCIFIICSLVLNFVQIPWLIYFILNILQQRKFVSRLMRTGDHNDQANLITKNRNKLLLHKYLFTTVVLEWGTVVYILINYIVGISLSENKIYFNCMQYYYALHLYEKNVKILIEMILILCILETLNLTTLFVKDVYLRNSVHSVMRKKINRFVMRFLLVLGLGVSGVGLGIAYVLCEVFLITQLVLYYRYSRQLYRALRMQYEDTKYEFGRTSVEARTVWKHMRHYKYTTIWFFIIILTLVFGITVNEISLPYIFLDEECIQRIITNHNLTFTNSTIFRDIDIAISTVSSILYLICLLMLMPVYTAFSVYYLCDKFLFVRVYQHRYHVRYSQGYDNLVQSLVD